MKRLVVFDLDGTLVDSTADIATAFARAVERVAPGTPPLDVPAVRSLIGNGARNLVERGLARLGVSQPVASVLPVFLEEYRSCLLDTTRLYPGTAEALTALGPRVLAVLTNKPGDLSRALVEGLGLGRAFARVIGSGDGPASKPDPAGLILLMQEFAASPAETLMVGDSPVDVATARAAGVAVAGVAYGLDPERLAAARPDFTIGHPRELLELC
jgi:phosphoglycolate phosphatase